MINYKNARIARFKENNPDLWSFFNDSQVYANNKEDDCQRWRDTLEIAYFISIGDTSEFTCVPNKMKTESSESSRNHHGEDCVDFRMNCATKISKEEYDSLRASVDNIDDHNKSFMFYFENIFYLESRANILKEDFLIIKPIKRNVLYSWQIAIVAQLKNIEGYYLFEFNT